MQIEKGGGAGCVRKTDRDSQCSNQSSGLGYQGIMVQVPADARYFSFL